ncbi:hypothetical protein WG8_3794 [Paenibacillus sp. Aloe-11]|nr:hypothetical protein WG8_3794 [Paenibacillus sp. Aloe-11]
MQNIPVFIKERTKDEILPGLACVEIIINGKKVNPLPFIGGNSPSDR